jgi:stage III sporulation protein SpoIIIAA
MSNLQFQNDIEKLVEVLPQKIREGISYESMDDAIEIVLDLGRVPEIRHSDGKIEYINVSAVEENDLEYIISKIPEFTSDNRSGIAGTLHRISAIRNRQGKVVGLTCRIGRVVTGTISCIKDICLQNKSILFLGRPGVGKTTKLREISRLVADELAKRVVPKTFCSKGNLVFSSL